MSNIYDFPARQDHDAAASASVAQGIEPRDAARAFQLEKVSGMSAQAIADNPEEFEQDFRSHLTSQIISNNAELGSFINSHPLHGALVKNDIPALDRLTGDYKRMVKWRPFEISAEATAQASKGRTDPGEFEAAAQKLAQGLTPEGREELLHSYESPGGILARWATGTYELLERIGQRAASGEYHRELSEGQISPQTAGDILNLSLLSLRGAPGAMPTSEMLMEQFLARAGEVSRRGEGEAAAAFGFGPAREPQLALPKPGEPPAEAPTAPAPEPPPEPGPTDMSRRAFLRGAGAVAAKTVIPEVPGTLPRLTDMMPPQAGRALTPGPMAEEFGRFIEEAARAQPFVEAGEHPPTGVSDAIDVAKGENAKFEQDLIKSALDSAEKTELKALSPEKFGEFLGLHPDGSVSIGPDALRANPKAFDWLPQAQRRLEIEDELDRLYKQLNKLTEGRRQAGEDLSIVSPFEASIGRQIDELSRARGTGNVEVPASEFLAKFDSRQWDTVKDDVSLSGHSVNDAKELAEAKQARLELVTGQGPTPPKFTTVEEIQGEIDRLYDLLKEEAGTRREVETGVSEFGKRIRTRIDKLAAQRDALTEPEQFELPPPKSFMDRIWDNYASRMTPDEFLESETLWGSANQLIGLTPEQVKPKLVEKLPEGAYPWDSPPSGMREHEAFAWLANQIFERMGAQRYLTPREALRYMGKARGIKLVPEFLPHLRALQSLRASAGLNGMYPYADHLPFEHLPSLLDLVHRKASVAEFEAHPFLKAFVEAQQNLGQELTQEEVRARLPSRIYNVDGQEVRYPQVIDKIVSDASKGIEVQNGKKLTLVIGPMAAGKSSIIRDYSRRIGSIVLDTDRIKEFIPEYGGGLNGYGLNSVQTEASMLRNLVVGKLYKQGANITLEKIGNDYQALLKMILNWQEHDYMIDLIHVHAPIEELAPRAVERFIMTGRMAPLDRIAAMAEETPKAYEFLKGSINGRFASYDTTDLSAPRLIDGEDITGRAGGAGRYPEPGDIPPRSLGAAAFEPRIFVSAKAFGRSEKDLKAYLDLINKQTNENEAWLAKRREAQAKLEDSEAWRKASEELEPAVRAAVEANPLVAAWQRLKKVKLDRMHLTPKQAEDLAELVGIGGIHPDDAASMFDYDDSRRFLSELSTLARDAKGKGDFVDRLVKAEVRRQVQAKLGDSETERLDEELDQALSLTTMEMLHQNVLALGTRIGTELPLSKNAMDYGALQMLYERPWKGLTPLKLMNEAAREARHIERDQLKGDHQSAFIAAQNNYLLTQQARVMREIAKEAAKFSKQARRWRSREVANFPVEYTNWIQYILSNVGKQVDRTPLDLAQAIKDWSPKGGYDTLDEFVDAVSANWDFPVAQFLREGKFKDLSKMNTGDARALFYSIATMVKRGRDQQVIEQAGKAIDFADLRAQGTEFLQTLPPKEVPTSPTRFSKAMRFTRINYAAMVSTESVFNRWQMGNPQGVLNRWLLNPLMDAVYDKSAMIKEYSKIIQSLGKPFNPYGNIKNDLFLDPHWKNLGLQRFLPMQRYHGLSVIANIGNIGNLEKLALGYDIRDADGKPDTERILRWVEREMTKADVEWMQGFADKVFKPLNAKARANALKESDVPAEDIPTGVTIFGKTYDGWYYPLIPHEEFEGTYQGKAFSLEAKGYLRAATARGFEKARTGAIYPLSFDFTRVSSTINEMIHDINLRGPVRQFAKALQDREFRQVILTHYGRSTLETMEDWLKAVSNTQVPSTRAWTEIERAVGWFRRNTVGNLITFNISTPMKHFPTAAINSVVEVGLKDFLAATINWAAHPVENTRFVLEHSKEIQNRRSHWNLTLYGAAEGVVDPFASNLRKAGDLWRYWGSMPVHLSDSITTYPTWLAAYDKAFTRLQAGEPMSPGPPEDVYPQAHAMAVQEADRAVRRAHGSSNVAARPLVMLGGPLAQTVTSFYGLFSAFAQRDFEVAWRAKEGTKSSKAAWENYVKHVFPLVFASVVFPALVSYWVFKALYGEDRKAKDETTLLGVPVKDFPLELLQHYPVARDVAHALELGHDPTEASLGVFGSGAGAAWRALKETLKAGGELERYGRLSDREKANLIQNLGSGVGAVAGGFPGTQVARTMAGSYRWAKGQETPRTWGQLFRLLARGHEEPLQRGRR